MSKMGTKEHSTDPGGLKLNLCLCCSLTVTVDNMASGRKNAPELFTCGICTEPYDDNQRKAKFLTCHHTFCSHCLKQWHRKKVQADSTSIQCPNCNQLTDVPENGVDGLQTNFYIESMKEISAERVEPKLAESTEGCPEHGNQPKFFFCETCSMAICQSCTVLDHKETAGHVIIGIKQATDAHRNTLEDQLRRSNTAKTEIENAVHQLTREMQMVQNEKDHATETMVALIQFYQRQLEQYQQEATDAISQHHVTQHGKLLGKQRQLQEAKGLLEEHIKKSEETAKTDDISDIISSYGKLEKATQITKVNLDQRGNYIKSDLISDPNILNEKLRSIGQTYFKSILPTNVAFRNDELIAGLESVITVELFNDAGNKFPSVPSFITVQIIDPQQQQLPVNITTTHLECIVTFTPQVSGKHEISIMCLRQKLNSEQTHIVVNSNNPVLKFGEKGNGNGTFMFPFDIAMDNNGVLYVADRNNRLIQKFSGNGTFTSQFCVNVHDKDSTTLNMALDLNNKLIFCAEIGFKENAYSAKTNMLVFNLDSNFQHSHTLSDIVYPLSTAINREGDMIVSDINKKRLCKVDKEGKYICCMGDFKYPAFITIGDDDSIIVPDKLDDCIYIFNPDGTIKHKFGTSGTGKGQLRKPWGVSTDGDNILVSEEENNRVQVFKCNGEFVSVIESKDDPLNSPYGLVVTEDGYVYVADFGNHCIKKYQYQ